MAKKKKIIPETVTPVIVDSQAVAPVVEDNPTFATLRANLAEINKLDGVTGYILRNSTSAIIDLKEPAKLVDYAILSSQALDSSQEFSELFNLGNIENVLIEGKDGKVLCFAIGENKVSIFMEKGADHKDIRKQILPKAPKHQ